MIPPSHALPVSAATPRRRWLTPLAGVLGWALLVGGGFYTLVSYELKAGTAGAAPDEWPATAGLPRDARRLNLVLFAHPKCPCTRATVAELETILTRCPDEFKTTVCIFRPTDEPADWAQTSLRRTVTGIPGVEVIEDLDGRIAARFGAETSGQVLVFDRAGRKLFAGGITGARGHEGENAGRNALIALARGERSDRVTTPVFGCSLQTAGASREAAP